MSKTVFIDINELIKDSPCYYACEDADFVHDLNDILSDKINNMIENFINNIIIGKLRFVFFDS